MAIRHCVVCNGYHPEAEVSRWYRVASDADNGPYLEAVAIGGREPWAGIRGICDGCHFVITSDVHAELRWWKLHAEALDKNWATLTNAGIDAFREALGMPEATIPEMVHAIREAAYEVEGLAVDAHYARVHGEIAEEVRRAEAAIDRDMIRDLRSYADEADYDFDPEPAELFRKAADRIEWLRTKLEGTGDGH
jgi:hypothetical protein